MFKTVFILTYDHLVPLDPEKLAAAISGAIAPIAETKPFRGNVLRTETQIHDYNKLNLPALKLVGPKVKLKSVGPKDKP